MNKQFKSHQNSIQSNEASSFGISGCVLKWIAILTMLIDHIGASVFRLYLKAQGFPSDLYHIYRLLRDIGRISFPIFIFLLVEGFYHTRSRKKYLLQMLVFAFISEVPFDLAIYQKPFYWQSQNVYFTLLIGLFAICMMDHVHKMNVSPTMMWAKAYIQTIIYVVCAIVAYVLQTDYDYVGVTAIVIMYLVREYCPKIIHSRFGCNVVQNQICSLNQFTLADRISNSIAHTLCVLSLLLSAFSELFGLIGVPLIFLYNGKRGKQVKYFFYLFYPVHLLILYGIIKALGF